MDCDPQGLNGPRPVSRFQVVPMAARLREHLGWPVEGPAQRSIHCMYDIYYAPTRSNIIYTYIYAYHKWMSTFAMSPTWWQHDIFFTIKSLQRSAAQATSSCGVTRIPGIQRGKLLDLTFKATDFTRWIVLVPKILIFANLCLERCELYLPRSELWL